MNYIKYLSLSLFLSLLITFIMTYFYLRKIEDCECLLGKKGEKNHINIKRLEHIQIVIIIIVIIDHFFILNTHIDKLGFLKIFLLLFILILYGTFIYYIYYFSQNINNPECNCGKNWERYVLYKQYLLYIFVFFIISISLIFNIEHKLLYNLYESSAMKNIYYLIKSIFK